MHADRVIIANNILDNATCALKVMHGSGQAIVTGNPLIRRDLWALVMLAGTGSPVGDNVDGPGRRGPQNIRFHANLFTPGSGGVSNVPLSD